MNDSLTAPTGWSSYNQLLYAEEIGAPKDVSGVHG